MRNRNCLCVWSPYQGRIWCTWCTRYAPHPSHCCLRHGCKYGKDDCTVTKGLNPQEHPCEMCGWETEEEGE